MNKVDFPLQTPLKVKKALQAAGFRKRRPPLADKGDSAKGFDRSISPI